MDAHPLADELRVMAEAGNTTVDELLALAVGTAPANTGLARALRAGWASYDLDIPVAQEGNEP